MIKLVKILVSEESHRLVDYNIEHKILLSSMEPEYIVNYYADIKEGLQRKWKPIIIERDGASCVVCSMSNIIDLAHVKPVLSFVKEAKCRTVWDMRLAMERAYTMNNMHILCRECHGAEHGIITNGTRAHHVEIAQSNLVGW